MRRAARALGRLATVLLVAVAALLPGPRGTTAAAQPAGCDPATTTCPIAFGRPAFATLSDGSSVHRWQLEVPSAGEFQVTLAHPQGLYRLAVEAGSESGFQWSAQSDGLAFSIGVQTAGAGLLTFYVASPNGEADEIPYVLFAAWGPGDGRPVSSGEPLAGTVAPPQERQDALPSTPSEGAIAVQIPPPSPPRQRTPDAPRTDVAPAAPSGLIATPLESLQIRLTWIDNSNNEAGFRVSSGPEYMATVEANNPTYLTEPLGSGRTRCYSVQAYNDAGNSSWTEAACAATRMLPTLPGERFYPPLYPRPFPLAAPPAGPQPPHGLRAVALNHNTIRLDWNDNSDNENGFMVDGTGGFYLFRANTSTANVGGLLPATSYCFRVGAYNEVGEGWSNEACATTRPDPAVIGG